VRSACRGASPASAAKTTRRPAGPAVTLHAYAPPLRRMGAYEEGPGGVLLRHARPAGEELKPVGEGRLAA
jgi:hypothetical protein